MIETVIPFYTRFPVTFHHLHPTSSQSNSSHRPLNHIIHSIPDIVQSLFARSDCLNQAAVRRLCVRPQAQLLNTV